MIDDLIEKTSEDLFIKSLENYDAGYSRKSNLKMNAYLAAIIYSNAAIYRQLEELIELLKN